MARNNQLKLQFVSQILKWSGQPGAVVQFDTAWLPKKGPMGGRIVVDRIIARATLDADITVGALLGEDVYRAFGPTTVKQVDGILRFNEIPGDAMRSYLYEALGAQHVKEHADVAVANGTTIDASMVIPLEKPNMHDGGDYSLAASELQHVRIRCATDGDLSVGGATVAINSGDYFLIFECHEELDFVYHAIDEVKIQDFSSTTSQEENLRVEGRLQELILMVRGGEGGADLANLTAAWIHQPQWLAPELQAADLKDRFARERGEVPAAGGTALYNSPFTSATTRAIAVLMATGTKAFESPVVESAVVKVEHTLGAIIRMIVRVAKPRLDTTEERLRQKAMKAGFSGRYRVKTSSNSRRRPDHWPADVLPYLPIKFVA